MTPLLTVFGLNRLGGVTSYYSSLVRSGCFSEFAARYIALDAADNCDTKPLTHFEGAPTEVFSYSSYENRYSTFRRLARRIPRGPGVVLTSFPLELGCLDVYRRPDLTVVYICHDEFYVEIARQNAHIIDLFVAHNPHFAERLMAELPADRTGDVRFLPFGIRQELRIQRNANTDRLLRVVFIGRLHKLKGILALPAVDDALQRRGVSVEWRILGSGPEEANFARAVTGRQNFAVHAPADDAEMLKQAAEGDVFVLPSRLDGTPVAVMEAMSVGLVPVVSEFNPGAHWMVPPHTGLVYATDEVESIAGFIARLASDRRELESRSQAAAEHAVKKFDMTAHASLYKQAFSCWDTMKRHGVTPRRWRGGSLDQPWLPNAIVVCLRRMLQKARDVKQRSFRGRRHAELAFGVAQHF